MTDIPEEVMEAARATWRRGCNYSAGERIADGPMITEIARAILAERERCAKVAKDDAARIRSNGMYPAFGLNAQAQVLDDLAAAILKGDSALSASAAE